MCKVFANNFCNCLIYFAPSLNVKFFLQTKKGALHLSILNEAQSPIGSLVTELLRFRQTDERTDRQTDIDIKIPMAIGSETCELTV